MKRSPFQRPIARRWSFWVCAVLAVLLAALTATWACRPAPPPAQRVFRTPEDGVNALLDATKKGSLDELIAIFGPEGKALVASSDPASARRNREVFVAATSERWRLVDESTNTKVLVVGNEEWPFPVPLVRDGSGWRFDTAAGREEVIARRIGRNELAAIRISQTYVLAQRLYARRAHDGNPAGTFAAKFRSDSDRENGLYWPPAPGRPRSPLGDLVARAAEERRAATQGEETPSPFHGYYFKILTSQGPAAPGGAKSYVVAGRMNRGFALAAWPAQYDVTGVMTFIVNHDGLVRQKDLGPETDVTVKAMSAYNPDSSWTKVE
ncbi:MAG: DUF2950 domain-containing protein [Acidobacteriota bacterium]